jgi:hypothetical protein
MIARTVYSATLSHNTLPYAPFKNDTLRTDTLKRHLLRTAIHSRDVIDAMRSRRLF